jgi:hypothetical protein
LTGGLAVALDGISMWLAYKLFEIAQMADGQESSTRYITMDASAVPSAEELGMPADLADRWRDLLARSSPRTNRSMRASTPWPWRNPAGSGCRRGPSRQW